MADTNLPYPTPTSLTQQLVNLCYRLATEMKTIYNTVQGKADKSDIPTVPDALKNPNALTVSDNSGNVLGTYDGSAAVNIDVATKVALDGIDKAEFTEGDTTVAQQQLNAVKGGLSLWGYFAPTSGGYGVCEISYSVSKMELVYNPPASPYLAAAVVRGNCAGVSIGSDVSVQTGAGSITLKAGNYDGYLDPDTSTSFVVGLGGKNVTIGGAQVPLTVGGVGADSNANIPLTVNGNAPDENGNFTVEASNVDLSNYYTKEEVDQAITTAINCITNGDEVSY